MSINAASLFVHMSNTTIMYYYKFDACKEAWVAMLFVDAHQIDIPGWQSQIVPTPANSVHVNPQICTSTHIRAAFAQLLCH